RYRALHHVSPCRSGNDERPPDGAWHHHERSHHRRRRDPRYLASDRSSAANAAVRRLHPLGDRLYVVLLGLPGAGKGTQAALLKDETGLPHVTTGELFRENIRLGTELGKKAQPYVESGRLVPDEITIGMLLNRISQPDCARGCMLDGFPRNVEQARALDE